MPPQTIAVLDQSELNDGQMKEVPFEHGKVLLSRLGDTIHATSAYCTHYGAPLSKGVLTADGRVVCPWHGACFNVCTGDIEDAPAASALHSFKVQVSGGKIKVTADPSRTLKENASRPPKLLPEFQGETGGNGVVIVGGGGGAFAVVESLREHGYASPITILTREPHTPIDRPKLSKALNTDASKVEWKSAADLKIKYGTNIRTGVTVTSLSIPSKTLTLANTKEKIPYDTLVLATGADPRRLLVPGAEEGKFGNVFTLRGIKDSKAIDIAAQEGKRAVVIGSSFISMELVAALSKRKLASIDVIGGMAAVPFEVVLGKEVGRGIMKYHESHGVKFHMTSTVSSILASPANPSLASAVVVGEESNTFTLPADFVVMGVGVKPATQWLEGSGVELRKEDGGVRVDEYLRVRGVENIWAVGDIAVYLDQNGTERRIEHWNVAGNHGRAVGKSIAEGKLQPFVKIPVFWSAQGQQLRYCGTGAGYDDVIIKGDPNAMKFIAYYVKTGKVVAVASMQNDPVVIKASELLRLGLMPSAEELRGGKNLLDVDISSASRKEVVEGH
jgi:NADPH-dependent 2,4-dienoyl-CoA reductase/sulfur reductase-like enzyme/nitrite reductase/ring-hydroxylating ferredoxin subunit